MTEKYVIICPTCKSHHDVRPQLDVWKEDFIQRLNKLVEEMKEE